MLVLHLQTQYKNMIFEQKGTSLVQKYGSVCGENYIPKHRGQSIKNTKRKFGPLLCGKGRGIRKNCPSHVETLQRLWLDDPGQKQNEFMVEGKIKMNQRMQQESV